MITNHLCCDVKKLKNVDRWIKLNSLDCIMSSTSEYSLVYLARGKLFSFFLWKNTASSLNIIQPLLLHHPFVMFIGSLAAVKTKNTCASMNDLSLYTRACLLSDQSEPRWFVCNWHNEISFFYCWSGDWLSKREKQHVMQWCL